eukprot:CAMPEP_0202446008 /NCGR_PEP_ID=MMETSP1360-20130828/4673_1 /ASSEMBLY_ACC=CAM_ASM_000848 /TAXON_ID=515479 /ORGANISM="Licmophora paradoxa, Strain CCMP2313" /LENGTH=183 /DNA_ID=CAMNT_0049062425 /DNA_START=207 /DNA_END=758 /DNA_ORIENTATION=-
MMIFTTLALAVLSTADAFTVHSPSQRNRFTALQYSNHDVTENKNIFKAAAEDLLRATFSYKKPKIAPTSLSYDDGPFDAYDVLDVKPWKKELPTVRQIEEVTVTEKSHIGDDFKALVKDLLRVFNTEKPITVPTGLSYCDGPFDAYDVLDVKPWKKHGSEEKEEDESRPDDKTKARNTVKGVV